MISEYFIWTSVALVCGTAVLFYLRVKALYRSLGKIPGSPPAFLIGNIPLMDLFRKSEGMRVHGIDHAISCPNLYRDAGMHFIWYGLQPVISVYKAEIVQLVLGSTAHNEKPLTYKFLHKWIGTGLLTSSGEKWRHRRRLLTPSFHFRILQEDFLPVFNQKSVELVQKLKSRSDEEYVDIAPLIVLCTLDAICETIMGVSIGAQKGQYSDYCKTIHNLSAIFHQRANRPWLWHNFVYERTERGKKFNRMIDILHNFTDKVIKQKKEKLRRGGHAPEAVKDHENLYCGKVRKAFMDLLLDMHLDGQKLSEADIREEVDTFMFEGHDTTAMGTIFALYSIGLHPGVQERISEELDTIFGGDTERHVTYNDAGQMKYLECVLKECMRLYPPVPIISRKLDEDIHYGDFTIPKTASVQVNFLGLHRDPAVFPDPEVFDPDRFLPVNSAERHPYAYVPFSAGPRNCIGQKFAMMELKIIVSNILRHFTVVSLDQRDKFKFDVSITLRPTQEVRMKFLPKI